MVFESVLPTTSFWGTFEDDLPTAYFYAFTHHPGLQILDALHIYNVADVIYKDNPSKIQIALTGDRNHSNGTGKTCGIE